MKNSSKNHHYVPQYLLKNFGFGKKKSQIYVFNKTTNNFFPSSITKAGSENYFNSFQHKNKEINFEEVFQNIDNIGSKIIQKIINEKSISSLNQKDLSDLSMVVAVQLFRTKIRRTSYIELNKQFAEHYRELGYTEHDLEELISFGDNESKLLAFQSLSTVDEIANLIFEKKIVLLFNKSLDNSIWISDNPVVTHNVFSYGSEGISEKGIEIYFPISSNLCIGFYCPSIYLQLKESLSLFHPRPPINNPWLRNLFHGMKTFEVVPIEKPVISWLNELQIRQSSRFIYSQSSDFNTVISYLNKRPELKEVKTRYHLGKFGEAPPRSKDFPLGEYVVFYGRNNHHMLPVYDVEKGKIGFRFATSDNLKLKFIEEDAPFSRVEYFVNGRPVMGLSKAKIERLINFKDSNQVQARIKHIDESLNQLFEKRGI
jgi:hypothetical protein